MWRFAVLWCYVEGVITVKVAALQQPSQFSEERRRPHLIPFPFVVMNCPPLGECMLFISDVFGEDTVPHLRDLNR